MKKIISVLMLCGFMSGNLFCMKEEYLDLENISEEQTEVEKDDSAKKIAQSVKWLTTIATGLGYNFALRWLAGVNAGSRDDEDERNYVFEGAIAVLAVASGYFTGTLTEGILETALIPQEQTE
jgi:hypothetical protein